MKYPRIALDVARGWHDEQCYVDGEDAWYVRTLWEAAENLPAYDIPIVGMNIDIGTWDDMGDFLTYLSHVTLINKADLKYPIILDPLGNIADGRHRVAKAIVTGKTTIKVIRLPFMPEPDLRFDEDGNTI